MAEERSRIAEAIRRLREGVHWRPGKDVQHLAKRIELGHLPAETTMTDYPYNDTSTNMLSNTKSCGRVKTGFPWSLVTAKPRFYVGKFGRCTQVTGEEIKAIITKGCDLLEIKVKTKVLDQI